MFNREDFIKEFSQNNLLTNQSFIDAFAPIFLPSFKSGLLTINTGRSFLRSLLKSEIYLDFIDGQTYYILDDGGKPVILFATDFLRVYFKLLDGVLRQSPDWDYVNSLVYEADGLLYSLPYWYKPSEVSKDDAILSAKNTFYSSLFYHDKCYSKNIEDFDKLIKAAISLTVQQHSKFIDYDVSYDSFIDFLKDIKEPTPLVSNYLTHLNTLSATTALTTKNSLMQAKVGLMVLIIFCLLIILFKCIL